MQDIKVDTNAISKNDFPELEGKFLQYDVGTGEILIGVVIGCNRQVGVTIVEANNKNWLLVCAPGPILKDHAKYELKWQLNYNKWFDIVVDGIKSGKLSARDLADSYGKTVGGNRNCNGNHCAYSR